MKANAGSLVALTPWFVAAKPTNRLEPRAAMDSAGRLRSATGKEPVDVFVDLGERVRRYRSSCVGSLVGGVASRAGTTRDPGCMISASPTFDR